MTKSRSALLTAALLTAVTGASLMVAPPANAVAPKVDKRSCEWPLKVAPHSPENTCHSPSAPRGGSYAS